MCWWTSIRIRTPRSIELMRLLAGPEKRNLCVVGDDDQSIYGWRGADDCATYLDFEKDFPDRRRLSSWSRTTAPRSNILDAANQVIAHNAGRKEKALWTEGAEGEKIGLYHAHGRARRGRLRGENGL